MKKFINVFLMVLLLALSGCGSKTDYQKLVNDLGNVKLMEYSLLEIGGDVQGVELNYKIEMASKDKVAHVKVLGLDAYLDSDNVYVNVFDNWFVVALTEDEKAELAEEFNVDYFEMEMPEGSDKINVSSGIEKIDSALSGKTYDEAVVASDEGYTFVGLEDIVSMDVENNQLTINANVKDENTSVHVKIGKTEKFEIPAEAYEGKEISGEELT